MVEKLKERLTNTYKRQEGEYDFTPFFFNLQSIRAFTVPSNKAAKWLNRLHPQAISEYQLQEDWKDQEFLEPFSFLFSIEKYLDGKVLPNGIQVFPETKK